MTITRSVDQEKQLTTFTAVGELSFDKIMATVRPFCEKQPTKNLLWDFRNAALKSLSSKDIENVVDYVKHHSEVRKDGKTAWVVSKTVDYGSFRMMETFGEVRQMSIDTKVCYCVNEATQWLDEDG